MLLHEGDYSLGKDRGESVSNTDIQGTGQHLVKVLDGASAYIGILKCPLR